MKQLAMGSVLVFQSLSPVGAEELAYWTLDAPGPPFPNSVMEAGALTQDPDTTTAESVAGIAGQAVHLRFKEPGPSTRLATSSGLLEEDSFGFSFFINPVYLAVYDSFIQKELEPGAGGGSGFDDLAWQVHLLSDAGNGTTSLELVVRGQNDGFASVSSDPLLTLGGEQSGHWIHVAGGYDASTGAVSLFVRDLALDLTSRVYRDKGASDMNTSDSASLSLGTASYEGRRIAFSANTLMDELRLFRRPLTEREVEEIQAAVLAQPDSASQDFETANAALIGRK